LQAEAQPNEPASRGTRLKRMHLFHLPGDIVIDRPGFKFFFPITTMLIVSAVVSLIAWLMRR
jgi:Protein of unknown function (DUF2905)